MLFHRMNTKSNIFTSGRPRVKKQVLVFMSEIKFDLTLKKKKKKKSVSFMLLFTVIKLLLTFRLLRQKTNFFLAIPCPCGIVQCV